MITYKTLKSNYVTCKSEKMLNLIITFLSFWVVVHVIVHFIKQRLHTRQTSTNNVSRAKSTLPMISRPLTNNSPVYDISNNLFSVRFRTNKLNTTFSSLANRLTKFWNVWFTIGVAVGIIAMFIGVGIMIMAGLKLFVGLLGLSWKAEIENTLSSTIRKRSFEEDNVQVVNDDHQIFIPVIPGVTLPISHFAYYLIALLICGVIHEAGHGIAAANEPQPLEIKSAGVFLYILYPGAFVEFDLHELKGLRPIQQLRIICAGAWHNAVTFFLGALLLSSGIHIMLMSNTAWRSVDGYGVSVVDVEEGTALFAHLSPSTLITKLDDFALTGSSLDGWNDYLMQNKKLDLTHMGFCASEKDSTSSLDCCAPHPYGHAKGNTISCFKRIDNNNTHQTLACLPTIPILVNIKEQRCLIDADCTVESPMCVLPYIPTGYPKPLRIYYKDAPWVYQTSKDQEKLVLYLGELQDVWEIVQVSILQPRWSWVPLWIPISLELILRYTVSFSIALCVLNIIPAFQLDGHHALTALLYLVLGHDDEITTTNNTKHKIKRLENGIIYLVTGLVGWVVLGTLISGLFRI